MDVFRGDGEDVLFVGFVVLRLAALGVGVHLFGCDGGFAFLLYGVVAEEEFFCFLELRVGCGCLFDAGALVGDGFHYFCCSFSGDAGVDGEFSAVGHEVNQGSDGVAGAQFFSDTEEEAGAHAAAEEDIKHLRRVAIRAVIRGRIPPYNNVCLL